MITLHTVTKGSGRPLILIHGFGTNVDTWKYVTPLLVTDYEVICVDLKGFGSSPKPDDGHYSIFDQAKLVCDYINARNLTNITLIGHSLGGGVALAIATTMCASKPKAIDRLILIDTMSYNQPLPNFIFALRIPVIGAALLRLLPAKWQVKRALREVFYDDQKIPNELVDSYAKSLQSDGARRALEMTAKQIRPSNTTELTAAYRHLLIPVLLVWGAEDSLIPRSIGDRLHSELKISELHVIHQCGHAPQEECPEETVQILLRFLWTEDRG